jgi:hypothetical protein
MGNNRAKVPEVLLPTGMSTPVQIEFCLVLKQYFISNTLRSANFNWNILLVIVVIIHV